MVNTKPEGSTINDRITRSIITATPRLSFKTRNNLNRLRTDKTLNIISGTLLELLNFATLLSHIAYQILIKLACVLDILSLLICFMYHV